MALACWWSSNVSLKHVLWTLQLKKMLKRRVVPERSRFVPEVLENQFEKNPTMYQNSRKVQMQFKKLVIWFQNWFWRVELRKIFLTWSLHKQISHKHGWTVESKRKIGLLTPLNMFSPFEFLRARVTQKSQWKKSVIHALYSVILPGSSTVCTQSIIFCSFVRFDSLSLFCGIASSSETHTHIHTFDFQSLKKGKVLKKC